MSDDDLDFIPLKSLPHGRFSLLRASGGDVLRCVNEENGSMVGCLEVRSPSSAMFYAEFPDNKGTLAGRLDRFEEPQEHKDGPPTFFSAKACRAYVNYGSWFGTVGRDDGMVGAHFIGSGCFVNNHKAVVGSPDEVSVETPYDFDVIHTIKLMKDEPDPVDVDQLYVPFKAGALAFTFFFPSNDIGHGVSVPLTLWFQREENDKHEGIPNHIVEEIRRLPGKS